MIIRKLWLKKLQWENKYFHFGVKCATCSWIYHPRNDKLLSEGQLCLQTVWKPEGWAPSVRPSHPPSVPRVSGARRLPTGVSSWGHVSSKERDLLLSYTRQMARRLWKAWTHTVCVCDEDTLNIKCSDSLHKRQLDLTVLASRPCL